MPLDGFTWPISVRHSTNAQGHANHDYADNNMYVGIKKSTSRVQVPLLESDMVIKAGEFQHSSFLYGARVTSAGLLKVFACSLGSEVALTAGNRLTMAN